MLLVTTISYRILFSITKKVILLAFPHIGSPISILSIVEVNRASLFRSQIPDLGIENNLVENDICCAFFALTLRDVSVFVLVNFI